MKNLEKIIKTSILLLPPLILVNCSNIKTINLNHSSDTYSLRIRIDQNQRQEFIKINDYKVHRSSIYNLRIIAGIYAGHIEVKKINNRYSIKGTYSEEKDPYALKRAIIFSASNNNNKVTLEKSQKALQQVYEQYAK